MNTNGSAVAGTRQRWWRGPRGEPAVVLLWLTAVAPVVLSVFSLALSVYLLIEGTREPEIWLSAPVFVKAAVKPAVDLPGDTGERARFYVQPRFVSAARNDRVAVISDLWLEVAAPDGGSPVPFTWIEQGTWVHDPFSGTSTYHSLADPAPLRTAFTMTLPAESVAFISASPGAYVKIDTQAATPAPV